MEWQDILHRPAEKYDISEVEVLLQKLKKNWADVTGRLCVPEKLAGLEELKDELAESIKRIIYFIPPGDENYVGSPQHPHRKLLAKQIIANLGLDAKTIREQRGTSSGRPRRSLDHIFADWNCLDCWEENRCRNIWWRGEGNQWRPMSHLEALQSVDASTVVISIMPDVCVRQVLGDLVNAGPRSKAPPVLVCEKVDLEDQFYPTCKFKTPTTHCQDEGKHPWEYTCRDPNCKDPSNRHIRYLFERLYHEIPLYGGHSLFPESLGNPCMYIHRNLARYCGFQGIKSTPEWSKDDNVRLVDLSFRV